MQQPAVPFDNNATTPPCKRLAELSYSTSFRLSFSGARQDFKYMREDTRVDVRDPATGHPVGINLSSDKSAFGVVCEPSSPLGACVVCVFSRVSSSPKLERLSRSCRLLVARGKTLVARNSLQGLGLEHHRVMAPWPKARAQVK